MTTRKKTAIFILVLSMIMVMAGCATKTYATMEEWFADNPREISFLDASLKQQSASGDVSMEYDIDGNKFIYRYKFSEKVFGVNDETDQMCKSMLDKELEVQRSNFIQSIDAISRNSGIDASLLSVHLEYYNPGDTEPCFTQVVTK